MSTIKKPKYGEHTERINTVEKSKKAILSILCESLQIDIEKEEVRTLELMWETFKLGILNGIIDEEMKNQIKKNS